MRGRAVVLGLAALLVAACGAPSASSSSSGSAEASASSTASSGSADGVVEIGNGRVIRATCAGFDQTGPTVVFVSGSQSAGDEWMALRKPGATGMTLADMEESPSAVFGQVTAFAPACAYDRPGTVRLDGSVTGSTPVNQPTTAMADVADLEAWLSAAQVAPPYVLVGHSWGGLIATLFAATYPSKTAGLVLVDPANPYLEDNLTAEQWDAFVRVGANLVDGSGKESPDYPNTMATVRAANVPDVPVVVLTSDKPFDFGAGPDTWPAWLASADRLAAELGAEHVTKTDSGHLIPIEQPGLVVDAVRSVMGRG